MEINTKKEILMKNNMLVKARYDLSLIQARVFMLMLYNLQKEPNGNMACYLSRDTLRGVINHNDHKTIKAIKEMLQELMMKKISFKEQKPNGKNFIWAEYNLLHGYEYDDQTDVFKLVSSQRVYELLTDYLQIGYTPINLKIFLGLSNVSSQRLYDLLRLWSNTKKVVTYDVEELKDLMMLEEKYNTYANFKNRVIKPAVKCLNDTKMFEIDFEENKTGRKVTSISFRVKDLDERTYFIENNGDTINNTPQKSQNPPGEFFITDESIFTKGTLLLFKKDFGAYDFTEDYMQDAFWESAAALFERDDVEKIYNKGYNFFKTTLEDKRTALLAKKIRKEEEKELWRG